METALPEVFAEFERTCDLLETHYRDMQDMEFTVEDGKLWMLQTRSGKRTAQGLAADRGRHGERGADHPRGGGAARRPAALDQLLHPTIDPEGRAQDRRHRLAGLAGGGVGRDRLQLGDAEIAKAAGKAVILVRVETSPDDIHGMHVSEGILTTRGGMTSHAAVVARGMGKPCVSGAGTIRVDYKAQTMTSGGVTFKKGDILTIDGGNGQVMQGAVPMQQPEVSGEFATLMEWADGFRRMGVRANAETPQDARAARDFGAQGIGLCRTEHMFFEGDRIIAVREMILAEDEEGRRNALAKLLPYQRDDFAALFEIMSGLPVCIRLLDPPLHEFLPHSDEEIEEVVGIARCVDREATAPRRGTARVQPDAGLPGLSPGDRLPGDRRDAGPCHLRRGGRRQEENRRRGDARGHGAARHRQGASSTSSRPSSTRWRSAVAQETGETVPYIVGTMIELPRACLRAAEIAETAEFFSFGTNDLTQTGLGISRDDAASFLGPYTAKGILPHDPFVTIDQDGVGEFVQIGAERGRKTRPNIKMGICGEHGGDPKSIDFCEKVGLTYVSCSPFRVPIARLAAAQAALGRKP